ncbi:thioesterase family protein [Mycobacterium avium subsp. hominissuis]
MSARLRIEPRRTDLDPVGHVNNNVFLVYAEEARACYLHAAIPEAWRAVVVVHNSIDYYRPVEMSETVEVTSAVAALGTSSLTTVNTISTVADQHCATVRTVQVVLRPDRSGSRPWSPQERAALEALIDP